MALETQVVFAIESHMDMAADKLGIDRIAIRKKNLLREGDENASGEIVHSIGNEKCLDEVAEFIKMGERSAPEGVLRKGKGLSVGNKYSLAPSASSARIKVTEEGNIIVYHGSSELGQGCDTVMAQIAAEEFGIPFDRVSIAYSDSLYMPYDFGTISSRVTYMMGNAVILACRDAKRQIFGRVGKRLGVMPEDLDTMNGVVYARGIPEQKVMIPELFAGYEPGKYGAYSPGGEIIGNATFVQDFTPEDEDTGRIDPKLAAEGKRLNAFYGHTAKAVEVTVNTETGEVKVIKCAGADDMGQPINPKMCEQQQDSGIAMGIASAIYEEVKLEKGRVLNPNFTDYRVVTAGDIPAVADMQTMIGAVPHKDGPYGAKGFAEGVMIGVDAAVANAVYDAVGIRMKEIPLNAEKMLKALKEKG